MLVDSIIEPISDVSTIAAQAAVEFIAGHSTLARDGWLVTGIKILISIAVFVAIALVVPVCILAALWWLVLKLLFPG